MLIKTLQVFSKLTGVSKSAGLLDNNLDNQKSNPSGGLEQNAQNASVLLGQHVSHNASGLLNGSILSKTLILMWL